MPQRLKGKSALHNMSLNKIQSKMIIAIEQINEKGRRDIFQRLRKSELFKKYPFSWKKSAFG